MEHKLTHTQLLKLLDFGAPEAIGWTCFLCCYCFPLRVPYAEHELDGRNRTVCLDCSEEHLKFCQEMEAVEKKKNEAH